MDPTDSLHFQYVGLSGECPCLLRVWHCYNLLIFSHIFFMLVPYVVCSAFDWAKPHSVPFYLWKDSERKKCQCNWLFKEHSRPKNDLMGKLHHCKCEKCRCQARCGPHLFSPLSQYSGGQPRLHSKIYHKRKKFFSQVSKHLPRSEWRVGEGLAFLNKLLCHPSFPNSLPTFLLRICCVA